MTKGERLLLWFQDPLRVMVFNWLCAFVSLFADSLHQCFRTTDPYGMSPFGTESLFTNLLFAVVYGTAIAVPVIVIGALGIRFFRLRGLTDHRLLIAVAVSYAVVTEYFCITTPRILGACRFDP